MTNNSTNLSLNIFNNVSQPKEDTSTSSSLSEVLTFLSDNKSKCLECTKYFLGSNKFKALYDYLEHTYPLVSYLY